MTCTGVIIVLQWSRPLESNFANNIETLNEVASLFALYHFMCFSKFIPEPSVRYDCGKAFIVLLCIYLFIHFTILFADVLKRVINKVRKKYYQRRNKKIMA